MGFDDLLSTPTYVTPDGKKTAKAPMATEEIRPNGERVIETGLIDGAASTTDEYLEAAGFDPKSFMLKPGTGIRKSDWQAMRRVDDETVIQDMQSVRLEVVERPIQVDVDELIAVVQEQLPAPQSGWQSVPNTTFGIALGDLQLGKIDGDGPEGTVRRFKGYVNSALDQVRGFKNLTICLAFLGDCLEGFVSQGGRNAWRTSLTITEQVRILRRLMLWAIDQCVDAGAKEIVVVSVPGNHDEAMRQPVSTRSDDSWATDALVAVSDALEMNPERYGHVLCYVPGVDEMDVTLDLSGLMVTFNHGHQYLKGGNQAKSAFDWWKSNQFSGKPAGQAQLMICGHGHHYQVSEDSGRTWCMVPPLEELSVWWEHRSGQGGAPGIVTYVITNGVLHHLSRMRLSGAEEEKSYEL